MSVTSFVKSNSKSGKLVSSKPIRFTVDLTPAAAKEVNFIKETFSLSSADVFRFGLVFMKIYTENKIQGKEIQVVDPKKPQQVSIITLPLFNDSG